MAVAILSRFWQHPSRVWLLVLTIVFGTEYGVMLLLPLLLPRQPPPYLEAGVDSIILTAVLAPVMWWTVVRPLREVIRLRAQFLTDLFSRIEADRRRTAHELHDGIGQSLSLLVSGLRSAHDWITDPEIAKRCELLLNSAQAALKDVKRLALGLRPSILDDLGLAPALERLVGDVRDQRLLEVTLDDAAIVGTRLAEPVETAVFRIVQEALANVLTHARARAASISIKREGGSLAIEVTDNGCGFPVSDQKTGVPGHLGLSGMRERATLLGGTFNIESAPNRGTRVTAIIPVGA